MKKVAIAFLALAVLFGIANKCTGPSAPPPPPITGAGSTGTQVPVVEKKGPGFSLITVYNAGGGNPTAKVMTNNRLQHITVTAYKDKWSAAVPVMKTDFTNNYPDEAQILCDEGLASERLIEHKTTGMFLVNKDGSRRPIANIKETGDVHRDLKFKSLNWPSMKVDITLKTK